MVVFWRNMNMPARPMNLLTKYAQHHFNMPLVCGRVVIYTPDNCDYYSQTRVVQRRGDGERKWSRVFRMNVFFFKLSMTCHCCRLELLMPMVIWKVSRKLRRQKHVSALLEFDDTYYICVTLYFWPRHQTAPDFISRKLALPKTLAYMSTPFNGFP